MIQNFISSCKCAWRLKLKYSHAYHTVSEKFRSTDCSVRSKVKASVKPRGMHPAGTRHPISGSHITGLNHAFVHTCSSLCHCFPNAVHSHKLMHQFGQIHNIKFFNVNNKKNVYKEVEMAKVCKPVRNDIKSMKESCEDEVLQGIR